MSSAAVTISKQYDAIKVGFTILQFNVKSTNQFPIYIKLNGQIPTYNDYDFIVQPNSNFTSPLINAQIISYYTTATDFKTPATITVYSSKYAESGNTPYFDNQSINSISGFPLTNNRIVFGQNFVLPVFQFQTMQMAYFTINFVSKTASVIYGSPVYLVDNITGVILGACNPEQGDTVIALMPSVLNVNMNLALVCAQSIFVNINLTFGNQVIYKTLTNKLPIIPMTGVAGAGISAITYIIPPATVFSLWYNNGNLPGDNVNITFTVQLSTAPFSSLYRYNVIADTISFVSDALSNGRNLYLNFVIKSSTYTTLRFSALNNNNVNPYNLVFELFDYSA